MGWHHTALQAQAMLADPPPPSTPGMRRSRSPRATQFEGRCAWGARGQCTFGDKCFWTDCPQKVLNSPSMSPPLKVQATPQSASKGHGRHTAQNTQSNRSAWAVSSARASPGSDVSGGGGGGSSSADFPPLLMLQQSDSSKQRNVYKQHQVTGGAGGARPGAGRLAAPVPESTALRPALARPCLDTASAVQRARRTGSSGCAERRQSVPCLATGATTF